MIFKSFKVRPYKFYFDENTKVLKLVNCEEIDKVGIYSLQCFLNRCWRKMSVHKTGAKNKTNVLSFH